MSFKKVLRALTCTLALVGSASSFAIAPDQPSQPQTLLEVLGPYKTFNPGAAGNTYSPTGPIAVDFYLEESKTFDAALGKDASVLLFRILYKDSSRYDVLRLTLDPDNEVGDVGWHSIIGTTSAPDLMYYNGDLSLQQFVATSSRFSVIELERDASGKLLSLAASFDFKGFYPRDPGKYQLTGRFWYNSDAAIPVPEPDTMALLLAGLAATGVIARRKAAKAC